MAGRCGECRYYDGGICERTRGGKNPSSNGCSWFSSNFGSTSRTCKDCSYYNALRSKCERTGGGKNPSSSCSYFKPY